MATKTKKSTYTALMTSAKTLFWKHGFSRVTVEEICKEAGISKMTFYRIYKNKNEIALRVLTEIMEKNLAEYRHIMKQHIPFPQKIKQVVLLKLKETTNISEELVKDIYRKEETDLTNCIEDFRKNFNKEFINDLLNAQKNNWIRKDLKPGFILFMLNDMNNKMMDKNLTEIYPDPQDLIMELTNFFFYGVSNIPE